MSHTRDVESGAIFGRLEKMMETVPLERTIHFDNLRITNCHPAEDAEGIGILEELVCGLKPVSDWLKERNITVTTEGYNGMPIDPSVIVSGLWHHDPPDRARQIFHRKIMGGGRGDHYGGSKPTDFGICNAIHQDFTYRAVDSKSVGEDVWKRDFYWLDQPKLTVSYERDWQQMVDWIYRGVLLYHFYLEREMASWEDVDGGVRFRFSDGTVAEVGIGSEDRLRVTMGDVLVAEDDERFIPRGGAVYAYSRRGSERMWTLPPALRGRALNVFELSRGGRMPAAKHGETGNSIGLRLAAGIPVKIVPERPGE
jgi:hypothetical protein